MIGREILTWKAKPTSKLEYMNPQHISDLGSGVLQTIFVFVGPEDAIWSCRRVCKQWNITVHDVSCILTFLTVCKENLAKEWIERNRFWKDDFTENDNGRIRHFKKSSSLWDYCFHRVTGSFFFIRL